MAFAEAKELYEDWHRFEPEDVLDIDIPEPEGELKYLGLLKRLDYMSPKWEGDNVYYYHHFRKGWPRLYMDKDGNYHIYGYIRITPDGIDDWLKTQIFEWKRPNVRKGVSKLGILQLLAYEDAEDGKTKTEMFGDRYYVGNPSKDFTYISSPMRMNPRSKPLAVRSLEMIVDDIQKDKKAMRVLERALGNLPKRNPIPIPTQAVVAQAFLKSIVTGVSTATFGVGIAATILGSLLVNFLLNTIKNKVSPPTMPPPPKWVINMTKSYVAAGVKDPKDISDRIQEIWNQQGFEAKVGIYEGEYGKAEEEEEADVEEPEVEESGPEVAGAVENTYPLPKGWTETVTCTEHGTIAEDVGQEAAQRFFRKHRDTGCKAEMDIVESPPKVEGLNRIFTYGTLRKGNRNERVFHRLGKIVKWEPATTEGEMRGVGHDFPAVRFDRKGAITGEVVTFSHFDFAGLDGFEMVPREVYRRIKIKVKLADGTETDAWAYEWIDKYRPFDELERIPHGDWNKVKWGSNPEKKQYTEEELLLKAYEMTFRWAYNRVIKDPNEAFAFFRGKGIQVAATAVAKAFADGKKQRHKDDARKGKSGGGDLPYIANPQDHHQEVVASIVRKLHWMDQQGLHGIMNSIIDDILRKWPVDEDWDVGLDVGPVNIDMLGHWIEQQAESTRDLEELDAKIDRIISTRCHPALMRRKVSNPICSKAQWRLFKARYPQLFEDWQRSYPVKYGDLPERAEENAFQMPDSFVCANCRRRMAMREKHPQLPDLCHACGNWAIAEGFATAENPLKYADYKEAVEGEGWAIGDYAAMISEADTERERKMLQHIRKEEQEHLDELVELMECKKAPQRRQNPTAWMSPDARWRVEEWGPQDFTVVEILSTDPVAAALGEDARVWPARFKTIQGAIRKASKLAGVTYTANPVVSILDPTRREGR